jgi:hypothetical protein
MTFIDLLQHKQKHRVTYSKLFRNYTYYTLEYIHSVLLADIKLKEKKRKARIQHNN